MTSSLRQNRERGIDWVAVSTEVARTFADACAGTDDEREIARVVVGELRTRCGADLVTVVEPTADGLLRVVAAAGSEAGAWSGVLAPVEGSLSAPVLAGAGPRRISRLTERLGNVTPITGIDDVLLLPVPGAEGTVRAVLTIGRHAAGDPRTDAFSDADLVPAAVLAAQLGTALHHRADTAREQRALLADERDRIALVMQAQVVQRLFRLGMTLQAAAGDTHGRLADVLEAGSDEIDETIKAIRATIYRVGG